MELTITLGDLIGAAAPIAAIVGAYMKLSDRLRLVEVRVELMWQHYERRISPRIDQGEA